VRIVTRLIAMNRMLRLGRQLREIERHIHALPSRVHAQLAMLTRRELEQAGQSEFPHLYGTPSELRYSPWGHGTDTGLIKARSDSAQVTMRGIALWLAVAYHETKDSPHANAQVLHRQLLRVLRQLNELVEVKRDPTSEWSTAQQTA
jgi:hypothetical protein